MHLNLNRPIIRTWKGSPQGAPEISLKEAIMTTQTIQIAKPQLIGSEKQIKWANDIIDNIIKILGEIEIPQGATVEQIAHVQKIIDTFFGRQESWVWIDKYSRFTSTTPKQTIFAVVMVDGGKK